MSIKIKRQSLMGGSTNKKKAKQTTTINPTLKAHNPLSQSKTKAIEIKKRPKTGLWIILSIVVLLTFIVPKPRLITYQKLNVVSSSIFWPGFLESPAILFDSSLTPKGNIEDGKIFLCDTVNQNVGCHKYQITKQEGIVKVLTQLILD